MDRALKVLLVEDDAEDHGFFTRALKELHLEHHVTWAKNYTELFALLEQEPGTQLIILDINIPGKDGKQCLAEIKSSPRYRKLPVVILTVSGRAEDVDALYDAGAHYYVVKPYSDINYKETIKRIFEIDWHLEQAVPPKPKFVINLAFA